VQLLRVGHRCGASSPLRIATIWHRSLVYLYRPRFLQAEGSAAGAHTLHALCSHTIMHDGMTHLTSPTQTLYQHYIQPFSLAWPRILRTCPTQHVQTREFSQINCMHFAHTPPNISETFHITTMKVLTHTRCSGAHIQHTCTYDLYLHPGIRETHTLHAHS
jgi:hypothetical protein